MGKLSLEASWYGSLQRSARVKLEIDLACMILLAKVMLALLAL